MFHSRENEYVKAAQNGDQTAFAELVKAYEKLVFRTIKSKVRDEEDALDLSQEVFIKLWRSLPNWRGDCKFSTYVYKICVNASLDFLRANAERTHETLYLKPDEDGEERPLELADESISHSPEARLEQNETAAMVRAAIDRLSPEQREAITLRDLDGYSYEEIAEMLGIGIGTVKSRISRARTSLREILSEALARKN